MIRVEVNNNIDIYGLNESQTDNLVDLCTGDNPAYGLLESMSKSKPRLKYQLARTPKTLVLSSQSSKCLTVPRGLFPVVKQLFTEAQFIDKTVAPAAVDNFLKNFELREYQVPATNKLVEQTYGVFKAPTGSGKTVCALSIAQRLGLKTLFIVHTGRLFSQTIAEVESKLGVVPGQIGNGKFVVKDFTVGMIQTLCRRNLKSLSKSFGLIIIDEAHRVPASTFMKVIRQFHAKHIYGFSATPWRDDGLGWALEAIIGPITANIDKAPLQKDGAVIKPRVVFVKTPYKPSKDFDPFDLANHIGELTTCPKRNKCLLDHINTNIDKAKRSVVLTGRVEHAEFLASNLAHHKPLLYHGQLSDKEKEAIGKEMKHGSQYLTIATYTSISEGFDVPNWEVLWLTTPFSSSILTIQSLGRISRASPGKSEALVYDFIDEHDMVLASRAEKRKLIYSQL